VKAERPKFTNKKLEEKKVHEPAEEKKPAAPQMSAPEKPKEVATMDPWNEKVQTEPRKVQNAWNRPLNFK
jgi:hypothetical protein